MTELQKTILGSIAALDERALAAMSNKGIYNRAVKDTEGVSPDITAAETGFCVKTGGCTVTVPADISLTSCTCPSRTVCRHIIGAFLLLKRAFPDVAPTPLSAGPPDEEETEDAPLPEKKAQSVRETAALCKGLLEETASAGLVRISDDIYAQLEAAAVRCHSVKAASAERELRSVIMRLNAHMSRRASFDGALFAESLARCHAHFERLMTDTLYESTLGSFRSLYSTVSRPLTILPLGTKEVTGNGMSGVICYYLDTERVSGGDFLIYQDLRPEYYGKVSVKRRVSPTLWDMGMSVSETMREKITLSGAKLSGRKLSSSSSSEVLSHSAVNRDIYPLRRLITDDLQDIAVRISRQDDDEEHLFFVRPLRCLGHSFDRFTQILSITLEDKNGCTADIKVKYTAERKKFIQHLERKAEKMSESPDNSYVIFVSAYLGQTGLEFFPIAFYDNISDINRTPAASYDRQYVSSPSSAACAEKVTQLLSEIRRLMTSAVHCGTRNGVANADDCADAAVSFGMNGLAALVRSLSDGKDILPKMNRVYDYINAAEKRLSLMRALEKMRPDNSSE